MNRITPGNNMNGGVPLPSNLHSNLPSNSPSRLLGRMEKLSLAVIGAENKYVNNTAGTAIFCEEGSNFIVKDLPRNAAHQPTTAIEAMELLDELKEAKLFPKEVRLVDFGSGIGSFMAAFSIYLEELGMERFSLKGFEGSEELLLDAQGLVRSQGIKNVEFVQMDFTALTEKDLRSYNMAYIYKPFSEEFSSSMRELLPRLAPGTILITRLCKNVPILQEEEFEEILPLPKCTYDGGFISYYRTVSAWISVY
ncbi:methyltransferase domain-containing protein, partial [Candidatus Margulisiibacteriota bacterium]